MSSVGAAAVIEAPSRARRLSVEKRIESFSEVPETREGAIGNVERCKDGLKSRKIIANLNCKGGSQIQTLND